MTDVAAVLVPIVALAIGVWCGIRIERHRRDREIEQLLDDVRDARRPREA